MTPALITEVILRHAYFRRFIVIDDQPRIDLNKIGNEWRQGTSHDASVSQQNEFVDHANLKVLLRHCRSEKETKEIKLMKRNKNCASGGGEGIWIHRAAPSTFETFE